MRDEAERVPFDSDAEQSVLGALVDGDLVEATCRGGGELYRLGHDPEGGWWCRCPARSRCCHLIALELVVVHR